MMVRDTALVRWWREATAAPDPQRVAAPWRIAPARWGAIAARTAAGAMADDYGIVASSIAFAAFLSVLPVLALVALAYGAIVPHEVVVGNVSALVGILPGDAQDFVRRWLVRSLSRHDSQGIATIISGLLTIFSARRVGRSLMRGINIATGIEQDRGPLAAQGVALAIVAAGFALMLAALGSLSGLAVLRHVAPSGAPGVSAAFTAILWTSLTLGPALALFLSYRYAPARTPVGWRWVLPGVLAALLAWVAATLGFGVYVGTAASYSSTYGSLSAVVVLQLWLMISAFFFLVGAKLNAEAMRETGRDATGA